MFSTRCLFFILSPGRRARGGKRGEFVKLAGFLIPRIFRQHRDQVEQEIVREREYGFLMGHGFFKKIFQALAAARA